MEGCNPCLDRNLAFASRRLSMDNIPQLPDQVGQPDFTRLRDLPANNSVQSILLLNAQGKTHGDTVPNPYNTASVFILSSDPLWSGEFVNSTTIRIVGPAGDTFNGMMGVIKPQIAN